MESRDFIEPATSGWASLILLPKKKNGEYRCVLIMQMECLLNGRTIRDAYPIPDIKDLLKRVSQANAFSNVDLNSRSK